MEPDVQSILNSSRLTPRTRGVLCDRSKPVVQRTGVLSFTAFRTLDAVTRRLIPQAIGEVFVEIAERIDHALGQPNGDGWRYASLPPDREAYERGLRLVNEAANRFDHAAFENLAPACQDVILKELARGVLDDNSFAATRWFDDLLAAATEAFVSHPATLARMGYSGFAFLPRWSDVSFNAAQAWELRAR